MGDRACALSGLHDHDPRVRSVALGALERLDALDAATLTGALSDPSPEVRRRAAEVAARHPDVDLVPVLADSDPSVVEMAAWACGEHETARPVVLEALIALAGSHPDSLVREAAVAALGAIGDDIGLPAVLAALDDRATVRRRAVIALAPFDGDQVDAALRRALHDRDWQVRQAAEDLLEG